MFFNLNPMNLDAHVWRCALAFTCMKFIPALLVLCTWLLTTLSILPEVGDNNTFFDNMETTRLSSAILQLRPLERLRPSSAIEQLDLLFLEKMIRKEDNERLHLRGRTSIWQPTFLSMGTSPRTAPNVSDDGGERRVTMPRTRYARDYFPSHL